jgi:cAMP-dependent protein kinase regulator
MQYRVKSESKAAPADDKQSKKQSKKDDNSDDDEDNFDENEEVQVAPPPKAPQPKSRRVSVSAESMDPNKLKAQMNQVTSIEKSPEVTKRLLEVVSRSPLLRTLDEDQRDMIVKAFSGPLVKHPGEDIIVQGDIGDIFYLLEEGLVDIYVSKRGGAETKVHTYTPGNSFGELAIMYNAPRAATCRAQTECKLWALDRVSFKVIVVAAAMQKRELYVSFLKQVPILESLTDMEIMTLADSMAEEKFEDEGIVCRQGDAGDYFYIVKEGTAVCTQRDANGQEKVVATLHSGNYFGEIALLTEKPRQATVKAQGLLKVLSVDRATFTRVLGNMEDIMKRNMDQYNKYAAQAI